MCASGSPAYSDSGSVEAVSTRCSQQDTKFSNPKGGLITGIVIL